MRLKQKYKLSIGAMKAFRRGGWAAVGAFVALIGVTAMRTQGLEFWPVENDIEVMGVLTVVFTGLVKFIQNFLKEGVET